MPFLRKNEKGSSSLWTGTWKQQWPELCYTSRDKQFRFTVRLVNVSSKGPPDIREKLLLCSRHLVTEYAPSTVAEYGILSFFLHHQLPIHPLFIAVSSSPFFDFYPISHDFPACCRIERKGFFIPIFEYLVSIPYPHYFSNFWQLQQILYNGKTIFRLIFNFSPFSCLLRSRYLYRDIFFTTPFDFEREKEINKFSHFLSFFAYVNYLSLRCVYSLNAINNPLQPPCKLFSP